MAVSNPARVDFCVENVARLGLAQQEALDAPSDRLVAYVLLDGEAVLGGNHALVQAELLAGAVVAAEEREHSVEHGPDFVNLVGLVHGLVRLIDQVQEAPEGASRPRPPKSKCRRCSRCRCLMGTSSRCQVRRRWLGAFFSWGR